MHPRNPPIVLAAGPHDVFWVESEPGKTATESDKSEFTILDANQKNWTFHCTKECKVFINDKEAKLADLQADNDVTITYQDDNGKLMASLIRCNRK